MLADHGLSDITRSAAPPHELRARLRVSGDHPVLAGHFPGSPLVPGVVLLDAVRQACEAAWSRPFRLEAIDDARFTAPLLPDVAATLHALVTDTGESFAVDGEWQGAAGRIASFRLRLSARP